MKTPWIKSLILLGVLALQSHAIFGIGGHWAPAPGLEVKASQDTIARSVSHNLVLDEKGLSGAQGFGIKLWLDCIPLVDVEFAGNLQFGYYDVTLSSSQGGPTVPLQFDLGVPGLEGKPFFARTYGDMAILYPFLKLPPVVNILKIYAGGGLTYGVATPILSPAFAATALKNANTTRTRMAMIPRPLRYSWTRSRTPVLKKAWEDFCNSERTRRSPSYPSRPMRI